MSETARRRTRLVYLAITCALATGCDGGGGATPTPRPLVNASARAATATAGYWYCYVSSEGIGYMPPPPALETSFSSEPTESGGRFTGGAAMQWAYRGLGDYTAIYIRNMGETDIPIHPNDFRGYGYDNRNEAAPVLADNTADWPASVRPGEQVQLRIDGVFTVVLWTIGGRYGLVPIPMRAGIPNPPPTPKPGC